MARRQAFITVRKGNKRLAVYDLTLVLAWVGRWEVDGQEVAPARRAAPSIIVAGACTRSHGPLPRVGSARVCRCTSGTLFAQ
jgi:hypothetical protein